MGMDNEEHMRKQTTAVTPADLERMAVEAQVREAVQQFREVKDSGARQDFGTGSVRDTRDGKGRFDLLPTYATKRLAQHFENGAKKYGDRNWEQGQPLSRYLDSALRHTFVYLEGDRSEDHLAAAAWNIMTCIETQHRILSGRLPAELYDLPNDMAAPPMLERNTRATI